MEVLVPCAKSCLGLFRAVLNFDASSLQPGCLMTPGLPCDTLSWPAQKTCPVEHQGGQGESTWRWEGPQLVKTFRSFPNGNPETSNLAKIGVSFVRHMEMELWVIYYIRGFTPFSDNMKMGLSVPHATGGHFALETTSES